MCEQLYKDIKLDNFDITNTPIYLKYKSYENI